MLIDADGGRAVAFAQLLAIESVDHRQVRERRQRRTQCAIELDLFRGVRDVIVAAHYDGDAHRDVVGDDGHIVDRRSVGTEDHEVVDVLVRKFDAVVDEIVPGSSSLGDAEANYEWHARRNATLDFLAW